MATDFKSNKISVKDNFFRMGGNSISAIKLLAITRKNSYLLIFQISNFFSLKTIENISKSYWKNQNNQSSQSYPLNKNINQNNIIFMVHPEVVIAKYIKYGD